MKTITEQDSKTLTDLFLGELADMYDAEHRIAKALPKMAKAAISAELKQAVLAHLEETKEHATKIEEIFGLFDKKAIGKTCKATIGLLEEADEIAADYKGSPSNDAALISAMQKVEHYEIASYGCLHAWAVLLENDEAADLITSILEQETEANDMLSELAESQCNATALGGV
ncbi:MAG: ferritin-like domain-containing protein [Gloeobacteraceae cyanobacterium ES-bin-144]|nr:ferritin-like domain-containing protein [Verrucomicrobiales bacterium]